MTILDTEYVYRHHLICVLRQSPSVSEAVSKATSAQGQLSVPDTKTCFSAGLTHMVCKAKSWKCQPHVHHDQRLKSPIH